MDFTRALQFVLYSGVDGTALQSIPFGETIHGRQIVHVEGVPIEEAQPIVDELVSEGYVEIVRWTPDGDIPLTRQQALEIIRNPSSWEPSAWAHEVYLTDSGEELYKAVRERLGPLHPLD